jgi:hypothetical protein
VAPNAHIIRVDNPDPETILARIFSVLPPNSM